MAAMYNRKLGVNIRNFQLSEYVTVAIPKAERTTCEMQRLPCQVTEVCGIVSLTYRLASEYGPLTHFIQDMPTGVVALFIRDTAAGLTRRNFNGYF